MREGWRVVQTLPGVEHVFNVLPFFDNAAIRATASGSSTIENR